MSEEVEKTCNTATFSMLLAVVVGRFVMAQGKAEIKTPYWESLLQIERFASSPG